MTRLYWLKRMVAAVAIAASAGSAFAAQTQVQYLSGKGKDDGVPWDFFCSAGQNSNKWSTIKVPSNWELQGFGTYSYGRDRFPNGWPKVEGKYKRTFSVPADWADRKVFLVFEGSMTDTQAWINGQSAGEMHQGGYYSFKYDVTSLVKVGQENLIEVTVDDESANTSVNRAERRGDYWNYGGIFRPVYLQAVPQQFIDRIAVDAKADGSIAADVFTQGINGADSVEAQVMDLQGNAVGAAFSQPVSAAAADEHVKSKIAGPRLWNAETPNLYQLEVRLKQGDVVIHTVRQQFGFRTIEVREEGDNKGVFVNGQRILLKGVCRHSFWPDSGRTLSEQISHDDVQLMKDMNMNAVRMTHYPPDGHFLDACDELGLYVLDEIAGWHAKYDTPIGHKLVGEMVAHDVNHPSILFWDNGNEGGFNTDLDDDFAKWDPQKRNVLHPWALFRGIDTKHYPNYQDLLDKCSGPNVYFATEMLHGLYDGGAGASLEDYWKVMRASKVAAGGFIWAFLDEDVKRTDKGGKLDSDGNQAPDGIVGPYREKEGSFYAIKQIWSPVAVLDMKSAPAQVTVENRFDFTDLNQCSFEWEYRHFVGADESGAGYRVIERDPAAAIGSIPPGAKGIIEWKPSRPAATYPESPDVSVLIAKDPQGRELWSWQSPRAVGESQKASLLSQPGQARVTSTEEGNLLTAKAGDLSIRFQKKTGMIDGISRAGKSFALYNGPRLVTGAGTLATFESKMENNELVISTTYTGDLQSMTYRIRPNGWLTLDYSYNLTGPHDYFGLGFDYSETGVRSIRYLGDGPSRVWKNRLAGGTLNVWEKAYNNTVTGDPDDSGGKLDYPEFKGYYSGVRWIQFRTGDGPITALLPPDGMYVQVLTPQFPSIALQGKAVANFPSTDIAFLDAIPPIGSKFVPAVITGPSAQQSVASGEYHREISLYFGELPK